MGRRGQRSGDEQAVVSSVASSPPAPSCTHTHTHTHGLETVPTGPGEPTEDWAGRLCWQAARRYLVAPGHLIIQFSLITLGDPPPPPHHGTGRGNHPRTGTCRLSRWTQAASDFCVVSPEHARCRGPRRWLWPAPPPRRPPGAGCGGPVCPSAQLGHSFGSSPVRGRCPPRWASFPISGICKRHQGRDHLGVVS